MARKPPTQKTLKRLFAVSGNKCAFTDCPNRLVDSRGDLQGEICHIEAANPGGERYNQNQTDDERRAFENLILLCKSHHTTTDDVRTYTVPVLKDMKAKNEARGALMMYKAPEKVFKAAQAQLIQVGDGDGDRVAINNSPNAVVNIIKNGKSTSNVSDEKAEVSILDEIFQTVLAKIKDAPSPPAGPSIDLNEKIELNFSDPKEQEEIAEYVRAALLKMSLIEGTFKNLGSEYQKDITAHIFQLYSERRRKGIKNINIMTELFAEFTPPKRRNDPGYTNLARAFVLFFFDDCTIFEKTRKEKGGGQG